MSDKKYVPVPDGLFGLCIARYPKLDEPDTKGKYADNKYKTEVVPVTPGKFEEIQKWLEEQAAKIAPGVFQPQLPIRKGKKDGVLSVVLKSAKLPKLWDAMGNVIPASAAVKVRGGSKIKVAGTLSNYDKGVNLYLDGVQIVELVGGRDVKFEAEESEDAFVYSGPSAPEGGESENPAPSDVSETPAPRGKFDL